jgi:hypothetical protein
VKIRKDIGFFLAGKEIPGFKDLDKEEKDQVQKKLPAISPSAAAGVNGSGASGSKRKLEEDEAGPSKRAKNEGSSSASSGKDRTEAEMAKQNKQMYRYRDALSDFKKGDLQQILSTNKQEIPTGNDKVKDKPSFRFREVYEETKLSANLCLNFLYTVDA